MIALAGLLFDRTSISDNMKSWMLAGRLTSKELFRCLANMRLMWNNLAGWQTAVVHYGECFLCKKASLEHCKCAATKGICWWICRHWCRWWVVSGATHEDAVWMGCGTCPHMTSTFVGPEGRGHVPVHFPIQTYANVLIVKTKFHWNISVSTVNYRTCLV